MAQHYTLISRISEDYTLESSDGPFGMPNGGGLLYPRNSHTIAAIGSKLVGSSFLAMHMVTILSVSSIWLSILQIIQYIGNKMSVVANIIIGLVSLISIGVFDIRLIHGFEVVGNFFYAQLVGVAFLFIILNVAVIIEHKRNAVESIIIISVGSLFLEEFHLIPGLEMLGMVGMLIFLHLYYSKGGNQLHQPLRLLVAVTWLSVLSFLFFRNNQFALMKMIANNNGSMTLSSLSYPYGLLLISLLNIFTSCWLLYLFIINRNRYVYTAVKYLSVYGLVVSFIIIAQYCALKLGVGSDYSVKKYAFDLYSSLVINASVLFSLIALGRCGNNITRTTNIIKYPIYILTYCTMVFSALSLATEKTLDTSNVIKLEHDLIQIRDIYLPEAINGKDNIVYGSYNSGPSNVLDYLFSMVVTKTRKEDSIPVLLREIDFEDYSYILSNKSNSLISRYANDCTYKEKSGISILIGSCMARMSRLKPKCQNRINFTDLDKSHAIGFSSPEPSGRWTAGINAGLICDSTNLNKQLNKLIIDISPLSKQRLEIIIDGIKAAYYHADYPYSSSTPLVIAIPNGFQPSTQTRIEFLTPDAVSPQHLGLNSDTRTLGFFFRSVIFE